MSSFFLKCSCTDDLECSLSSSKMYENQFVRIKASKAPNQSPFQAEVLFTAQCYKRKDSPCHYHLEDLEIHIFVLGMVFLSPDQRRNIQTVLSDSDIDEDHLPALYRKGGLAELGKLHGEYNIVVVNARSAAVHCISSRFGLLPLYYAVLNKCLYMSDSLARLGTATGYGRLNKAVLAQICLYNYSLDNNALLENCSTMPAGSRLSFSAKGLNLIRYWTPDKLLHEDAVCGHDAVDMIDDAFNRAVKRYAAQVDNTALSLTGGWDGRLILAYMLKHMAPEQIQLYSFGTSNSPDVEIPQQISKAMSLRYKPFILDQDYLDDYFLESARDTAFYSDGYRSIQRAHYLYAMKQLSQDHRCLLSGICGSNVMKAAATTPSLVLNSRVLEILSGPNPAQAVSKHLAEMKDDFPELFAWLDLDTFKASVFNAELELALSQPVYAQKVSCFIFGILERKFFGAELSSYRHLIGNYSPFIDVGFIEALSQTEFFNAHNASVGIFGSRKNALLYARLISRHNRQLAGFVSDKYVTLQELLNPLAYPLVAVKQIYRRKISRKLKPTINYYNTENTLNLFREANPGLCGPDFADVKDKNKLASMTTAFYWYNSHFNLS